MRRRTSSENPEILDFVTHLVAGAPAGGNSLDVAFVLMHKPFVRREGLRRVGPSFGAPRQCTPPVHPVGLDRCAPASFGRGPRLQVAEGGTRGVLVTTQVRRGAPTLHTRRVHSISIECILCREMDVRGGVSWDRRGGEGTHFASVRPAQTGEFGGPVPEDSPSSRRVFSAVRSDREYLRRAVVGGGPDADERALPVRP